MALKRLPYVLLVLIGASSTVVLSNFIVNTFRMNNMKNIAYGDELNTLEAADKLTCISNCSKDEQCKSATFDEAYKSCKTNQRTADEYFICDIKSGCSDPNPLLYAEKLCKTTMRYRCYSSADCMDADSLCVLGKCQCRPGLSYDRTSCACVGHCYMYRHTSSLYGYGTTFQRDPGMKIQHYYEKIVYDVYGVHECETICVYETSFPCRSFQYVAKTPPRCKFSHLTAFEIPFEYVPNDKTDTYTRDCA